MLRRMGVRARHPVEASRAGNGPGPGPGTRRPIRQRPSGQVVVRGSAGDRHGTTVTGFRLLRNWHTLSRQRVSTAPPIGRSAAVRR